VIFIDKYTFVSALAEYGQLPGATAKTICHLRPNQIGTAEGGSGKLWPTYEESARCLDTLCTLISKGKTVFKIHSDFTNLPKEMVLHSNI